MNFDYQAEAELFPSGGRWSRQQGVGYRRFAQAAEAIRFAIEELPAELLAGAWLEVAEERFDATDMRRLYDDAEYPLARRGWQGKRGLPVANREQRGSREQRKPNAEKPKPAGSGLVKSSAGRKER
jgi:hypothetical protein